MHYEVLSAQNIKGTERLHGVATFLSAIAKNGPTNDVELGWRTIRTRTSGRVCISESTLSILAEPVGKFVGRPGNFSQKMGGPRSLMTLPDR